MEQMNKPMMKCGHVANSTCNGKPSCVICAPHPDAHTPMLVEPDVEPTRLAKCAYNNDRGNCHSIDVYANRRKLAFYEYRPDKEFDIYYCGCRGWD